MAKLSLLDIVQDIANDLETDEINSINDTIESVQIAQIVKTTYFEMIGNRNWKHLKTTFQFDASGDNTKPTHMSVPVLVKEIITFNYNKRKVADTKDKYLSVEWKEPEEFLRLTNQRNSSETNITTVTDFGGVSLYIRNDKQPEFYTSFDEENIVMDSHDNTVDTTLQTSKTQVLGYIEPVWTVSDTFVPDLPSEAFPALLEEAKSTAFFVLKQTTNSKAEQKAQRQQRWLSRKDWKVNGGVRYPNYGRKRNFSSTQPNPLFDKNN